MAFRVSTSRLGTLPSNDAVAPPVNHPAMSTIRWALALVYTQTEPSAPIGAITPLATVAPGPKLTFEASGRVVPHGQTVAYPPPSRLRHRDVQRHGGRVGGTCWAAPFTVNVTPRTGTDRGVDGCDHAGRAADGVARVDESLRHGTDVRGDPHRPARTSRVRRRVRPIPDRSRCRSIPHRATRRHRWPRPNRP